MLTDYFKSPSRVQELREGPDGRLFEAFAQELHQAGYAKKTARSHLRAAEHLVHWTRLKGGPIKATDNLIALLKTAPVMRSETNSK